MIEFLHGRLIEKTPTFAVLQTGGVAFHLPIPLSSHDALPAPGGETTVHTRLVVREDDLTLYGFASSEERSMFDRLIHVSGIGPKIALTALSGMSVRELKHAIADRDIKRLSGISGIGKKMAERLVVELRDKLEKAELLELESRESPSDTVSRDAVLALVALGYKQREATSLLRKIPSNETAGLTVEELVRRALSGS